MTATKNLGFGKKGVFCKGGEERRGRLGLLQLGQ